MTTTCPNRKNNPRVSPEVCKYHVETGDPICLKRLGGKWTAVKCDVARGLLKGEKNAS